MTVTGSNGTGTINTNGLISDVSLVFDSTQPSGKGSATLNNITLNVDLSNLSPATTTNLGVGYTGIGSLTISSGAVHSASGYLGVNAGSTGSATVTGSSSTWANSGSLYVGSSGTGTLLVSSGGSVSDQYGYIGCNSGSVGTVTVDGTGSTWTNEYILSVGGSGNGMLKITRGATVSCNAGGSIGGSNSNSTGVVTVDGIGSTWKINDGYPLYVGSVGNGTLNITAAPLLAAMEKATSAIPVQRAW